MSAILEAKGLTVGYGTLAVARELNFRVEPGRVTLILGPNGAGKTTTLMTLVGALRPLSGEVRLAGECVTTPLHKRVQQGLAFVPMNAAPSPDSRSTRICDSGPAPGPRIRALPGTKRPSQAASRAALGRPAEDARARPGVERQAEGPAVR